VGDSTLVTETPNKKMKAIIINKYGTVDELKIAEVETPSVKPNEVLVKNYYTSINPMDYKARKGELKMFTGNKFPKIFGAESARIVEQVGHNITLFKKGDRVMIMPAFKFGTYAEYTSVVETSVFKLPDNVTFQQGASLTMAGGTAYCGLYLKEKIKQGDEVLINGAYGGIGSIAVQLAKSAGAKVTGVCSTENIKNVKALHADTVIDYTKQDLYTVAKKFDIVFDSVGKLDVGKTKGILKNGGVMVNTVPSFKVFLAMMFNIFSSKKIKSVITKPTAKMITLLANMVAEQKLKIIIDRGYNLEKISKAQTYSETGKAKGKILIKI